MSKLKMIFSIDMLTAIPQIFFIYVPLWLYVKICHKKVQCWLVTERADDARDNGYVLFKWLRDNHPEKRVIYAIHKSAPDYLKVKNLGEVIEYGSLKHWYFFFAASICCDTAWSICCPKDIPYLIMRDILPPRSKRVFLQHGITKDYMPQGRKQKLHADIFVCGAYPEWEYINREFGYSNGEVKYLGFTRFDRLVNTNTKRQILYMPTWREGLHTVHDFTDTIYFKKISSVLLSKKFNDYLKTTKTELVFFVHPSIKDKKQFFESLANNNIKVMNNEDYDLQKLICSANMLITDFSSIYFDFAYQGKPVVYYHFDYMEYRKRHYAEGYFSYENDGFGPIEQDEEHLISTIIRIADNNWQLSEKYKHRADRFFPKRDSNNCQRHYDALCELESQ